MKIRMVVLSMACLLPAPVLQAGSFTYVTVLLGQSAQDYTLVGQGPDFILGDVDGTYLNTQGACTAGASSTSCVLSGAFTGSSSGYTGGTYQFITTYPGTGPSELSSISSGPLGSANENDFNIRSAPSGTTMYLDLDENGGPDYSIPIFTNGSFQNGFIFSFVTEICAGTSLGSFPCEPISVGLFDGATLTGPVTGTVSFEVSAATPEPRTLWLLSTGLLGLMGLLVQRRRSGI